MPEGIRRGAMAILFISFLLAMITYHQAQCQQGYRLKPISGADGEFEKVLMGKDTVCRSTGTPGNYALYMYLQCDQTVSGGTVYLEVTYVDTGYGYIEVQYNSTTGDYSTSFARYQNYARNFGGTRTAVYRLRNADFRNAQNLGADLRLNCDGTIQMHILTATLYTVPTELFLRYNAIDWLTPYNGPPYAGGNPIDATTLIGKVLCGYQGWFRAPGDPSRQNWVHYANGDFSHVTVDLWPDMTEYSLDEQYPVKGWTLTSGSQATLFSSANKRTILRHFQWMEAYGIDGAAIQRFTTEVSSSHAPGSYRVLGYAREAANRTGRTYFVDYDISGATPENVVSTVKDDWRYLVDSMKITADSRYLHHGGKPVVGIFGFYRNLFSRAVADSLLDLFQKGEPYAAFVMGSGEWYWRTDPDTSFSPIFERMGAVSPWNTGNYAGDYARTDYWLGDRQKLDSSGVLYMPVLYPGFSWDNLYNLTPKTSLKPRLRGEFLWKQLLDAVKAGVHAIYLGMFDEIDEGTAIFKITNDIPVNHYFVTNEGLPSDFYLLLTGYGNSFFSGKIPVPASMPDFASLSQPPVPEIIRPAYGDTSGSTVSIAWTPVEHPSGITSYTLELNGTSTSYGTTTQSLVLANGVYTVRVRATNGLGNRGGWSQPVKFTVSATLSVVEREDSALPVDPFLDPLYPNPFNPAATIRFGLPKGGSVVIEVYAIDGSKVATLVDGVMAGGTHSVTFDAARLASGVYLVVMKAGAWWTSRKVVVLR